MRIKLFAAAAFLALALNTSVAQTEDIFKLSFRANCRTLDENGRLVNDRLTERDIIAAAVGRTNGILRQFVLVYNPTTDSIQVMHRDGTVFADVIQFAGTASTSDGQRSARFTFMFVPNQTNAIGSAVINERSITNRAGTNRIVITGNVQFALTDELVLGNTNAFSPGTNTGSGSENGAVNTNDITAMPPLGTNMTATSGSDKKIVLGTNTVADTNAISGLNTPTPTLADTNSTTTNSVIGAEGNPSNSGFFFSNSPQIQSNNLTNVRVCTGVFTGVRQIPGPTETVTNTVTVTNVVTVTNNVTTTNLNGITDTNLFLGTNAISGTNTLGLIAPTNSTPVSPTNSTVVVPGTNTPVTIAPTNSTTVTGTNSPVTSTNTTTVSGTTILPPTP